MKLNLSEVKNYIINLYQKMDKKKLIIGILFILLFIMFFSLIGECESKKSNQKKYEQNLLALNDTIRILRRNVDNLSYERSILIIDNKNLNLLNDSLRNEIKKLKAKVIYITIIKTETKIKKEVPSITVGDSVIRLDSNNRITKVSWENEYKSGSLYMYLEGYGLYYYYDSTILVRNFITNRYLTLDLKTYIFEEKGKYYAGISTLQNTPEVSFNLRPVIIDNGNILTGEKKSYKVSVGIGPHIGLGYTWNKQIVPYIGIGINLNYNLFNIY